MKANETKFHELVASNYQYVIPLFQRPYSWIKQDWLRLLDDIKEIVESRNEHFIGSIVIIPTSPVPAGVTKFLLIDGQQRMTTLFIVMMVLRDKARMEGNDALADEINDMIINRHKKSDDHYKLMPTQVDREAYKSLIAGEPLSQIPSNDTPIHTCYRFFRSHIKSLDIQPIFNVITSQLGIVTIVLDPKDNPYVVFESLNAKGRPLSQSDLIRNYFFMQIDPDRHDKVHTKYWQPMQSALEENTTEFIRHYLMRKGGYVRHTDVYQAMKTLSIHREEEFLEGLSKFSTYYQRILMPERYETDAELRWRMGRLKTLQFTVAYPFLLNVYDDVANNVLSRSELCTVIGDLENYIFRRAICGSQTHDLNKLFPLLYDAARSHSHVDFVTGVRIELQKRRYPTDEAFKTSLIYQPLYGAGARKDRVYFLLRSLEQAYGHKEIVDLERPEITIEHILPQSDDPIWRKQLGEEYDDIKEAWLHTLGNLTLTAYNPSLSNKPFSAKRAEFRKSNIQLNKSLQFYTDWNPEAIEHRGQQLAEQALEIWPDFRPTKTTSPDKDSDITGTKPYQVNILGREVPVKSWVDVIRQTLSVIIELAPDKADALVDEFPFWLSNTPSFKQNDPLPNGIYLGRIQNAHRIYRNCRRMLDFVEIGADDWHVEVREQ